MEYQVSGCIPAASVLGVSSVSCNECPFPFCVIAEAKIIKIELREHLTRIMQKLGRTVEEMAKAMEISTRSVYRYTSMHKDTGCVWCSMVHSQDVMCRSNTYTVVYKDGQYITILNEHRRATEREIKIVEYFIEYVFSSSTAERVDGGHDHWMLNKVQLEEAKKFESMCAALDKYTLSLSKKKRCLQVTRQ